MTLVDKIAESIALIQSWEHPTIPYYVAWSGGIDSQVALALVKEAGVKHEVFHHVTGIDAPETWAFIRSKKDEYGITFTYPAMSFSAGVYQNGLPTRTQRWCCKLLKEYGGKGRTVITGIRAGESGARSARNCQEPARTGGGHYVHPIFRWSRDDVWAYVKSRNLPYCSLYDEGITRVGCVMCPMKNNGRYRDMIRWPKLAAVWYRAAERYWQKQIPSMQRFATADDYWGWWLANRPYSRNQPRLISAEVVKPKSEGGK